jgi:hypothetical protein
VCTDVKIAFVAPCVGPYAKPHTYAQHTTQLMIAASRAANRKVLIEFGDDVPGMQANGPFSMVLMSESIIVALVL